MFTTNIAAASINQIPLDWEGNKRRIIEILKESRRKKINILCLPELCITAYGCQDLFYSTTFIEKASLILLELIEETHNLLTILGLPLLIENKLYNTVCVVNNKKILGFYCKQNLANSGVHYEKRWFNSWEKEKIITIDFFGIEVQVGDFDIEYSTSNSDLIQIGFEICEDAWRNNHDRTLVQKKEKGKKFDLVLNASASHFELKKSSQRENLILYSSKILESLYVYANLLGNDSGRIIYDGDTYIAYNNHWVAKGEKFAYSEYYFTSAKIDFSIFENFKTSNKIHPTSMSLNKAHSTDNELENQQFLLATTLGLYDYLRKSHRNGFVISLSGGADSSICAILVREMIIRGIQDLGYSSFLKSINLSIDIINKIKNTDSEKIVDTLTELLLFCIYQKTENNSPKTLEAAQQLSKELNAKFTCWTIDEEIFSYKKKVEHALNRKLDNINDDIALQNIQARARVPGVWMIANLLNKLLISTSNRSEGAVGYCTMDGDTAGAISPIASIDKHFIQQWLLWAEKKKGYNSLILINSLPPSAELRKMDNDSLLIQKDEDELMPYDLLSEIESLAIQQWKMPIEVYTILSTRKEILVKISLEKLRDYIVLFFNLWSKNQWKRERLAPSFHLGEFNIDPKTNCRFPILNYAFKEEIKDLMNLKTKFLKKK